MARKLELVAFLDSLSLLLNTFVVDAVGLRVAWEPALAAASLFVVSSLSGVTISSVFAICALQYPAFFGGVIVHPAVGAPIFILPPVSSSASTLATCTIAATLGVEVRPAGCSTYPTRDDMKFLVFKQRVHGLLSRRKWGLMLEYLDHQCKLLR